MFTYLLTYMTVYLFIHLQFFSTVDENSVMSYKRTL